MATEHWHVPICIIASAVRSSTLNDIKTYLKSDELKDGMADAGIVGGPNNLVGHSIN
jgi:hypothetical protein